MINRISFKNNRRWLPATLLATFVGLFPSCEKDVLTGQPEWLGNSVYERLEEGIEVNGEVKTFHTLLQLIDELGQKEVLLKTGSKTLFATTDEAYDAWFKNNSWGVRSFEELTLAQKKILFNNSMINNAYLIELMSNVSGNPPQKGLAMRRPTAASIYDSIPTMSWEEMPTNPLLDMKLNSWRTLRAQQRNIRILKDNDAAPMIHFLPAFMAKNEFQQMDLIKMFNVAEKDQSSISLNDSWINGKKVISREQTCKNGYIYVVDGVIEQNPNMAEIIYREPEMSIWSSMIERFSAPFLVSDEITANYQRLYNTTDTVFVKRYYSEASYGKSKLNYTSVGALRVPATLAFDPGLNQYMWANTMGYDMHYDAGAMIVPTDEAVKDWWLNGGGTALREEYKEMDSIPAKTLSKLLNVNMLPSLVDAIPSKFGTIVDDSKVELGIKPENIIRAYMGCNGIVYLVDSVFVPSEYRSVVEPALTHESSFNVIYYAIDKYDFGPYLNSMESKFSLVLPDNTAEGGDQKGIYLRYIDPCSAGNPNWDLYEFYYDSKSSQEVAAKRYECKLEEGQIIIIKEYDSEVPADIVKNRLSDLVDNLIVVGNIESGQTYYKTKAGSVLAVANLGTSLELQGGFQIENGISIPTFSTYNKSNGKSYAVKTTPQTAVHSVYEILKAEASKADSKCKLFYQLLADAPDSDHSLISNSTGTGKTKYKCINSSNNMNVTTFDNYNYTVYVPCDDSIQKYIDEGYLPTWKDYETFTIAGEDEKVIQAKKDSIANMINNFVRYHLQDNSVYIDGNPTNNVRYETAKLDLESMRFCWIQVSAGKDYLTLKDMTGDNRKVLTSGTLYNVPCREYWTRSSMNSETHMEETTIYSSSNAVIHQINGPLFYNKEQKEKKWRDRL